MQTDFLGLDLASVAGWAHSADPERFSGTWDLNVKHGESGGMRLVKCLRHIRDVCELTVNRTLVIAYEKPNVARGKKANMHGTILVAKFVGIVEQYAEMSLGIECVGYNLQTIKKHALADVPKGGKRDKDAMIAAAERKWDFPIIDDNHADALWLMDLARNEWGETNA